MWPLLLDGELVGRVDLKADRTAGVLRALGAFIEPDQDPRRVAPAMAGELQTMATWLDLADVAVDARGDLAGALRRAL